VRFLLIDRITAWNPGRSAEAVKNVALSEDLFDDHFPLRPIFPGVLLVEGMAQLAGLLLEEGVRRETGRTVKALMSIVERAKFRRVVRPGDALAYRVEVLSVHEAGGRVSARASLRGDDTQGADDADVADCHLVFTFDTASNPWLEAKRAEVLDIWMRGLNADGGR
jgi:3-hydroxyacyl-[acyl-carrier-protein] dehydratase